MKVDSGEIKAIAVLFGQQVSATTGQIADLGAVFKEIINDQDLSGPALETAKKYYEEIYLNVLQNTSCLFEDANREMIRYQLDFCDQVENSVGVQIDTEELKRAEEKIAEEITGYANVIDILKKGQDHDGEVGQLELFIQGAEYRKRKLQEKREKAENFEAQYRQHFSDLLQEIHHVGKLLTMLKNGIPFNADGTGFHLTNDQKDSLNFLKGKTQERIKKDKEEAPPDIGNRKWQMIDVTEKGSVLMLVPEGATTANAEDVRITQEYQKWLLKYGKVEIMAEYATADLAYHQAIVNTGINPNTGQPVSDIEKLQSWSIILSTLAVSAISIYGTYKALKGLGGAGKVSGADVPKSNVGVVQSRINLAENPTRFSPSKNAGMKHVRDRHYNLSKNAGQFTIPETDLKNILQTKQVVNTPVKPLETGGFERVVNINKNVGTVKRSLGGQSTTWIKVITDKAGNVITTYPIPKP